MHIDYDLHGIVGVRLLEPSAADVAVVSGQLGPIQSALDREPDIVIRFVDRLGTSSPLQYLGLDEAGFSDEKFFILRSKYMTGLKVQVPFDQIGQRCEIMCERGAPAVPLLIPILNLTALAHGAVPLHASAFNYQGTGVVVTGWSKGGKTEALLAFMAQGAEYVGDEWVYISGDGRRVVGISEPIRLWEWHLDDLSPFRARVSRASRARLRLVTMLHRASNLLPPPLFRRLRYLLKRQRYVDVPPENLFGTASCQTGRFDRLFYVASHDSSEIRVEPMDPAEVARRMSFSVGYERRELMAFYKMFRFAFPAAENTFIERADELQRESLLWVFAGKPAHAVYHPYPVSIPKLFEAMEPLAGRRAASNCQTVPLQFLSSEVAGVQSRAMGEGRES